VSRLAATHYYFSIHLRRCRSAARNITFSTLSTCLSIEGGNVMSSSTPLLLIFITIFAIKSIIYHCNRFYLPVTSTPQSAKARALSAITGGADNTPAPLTKATEAITTLQSTQTQNSQLQPQSQLLAAASQSQENNVSSPIPVSPSPVPGPVEGVKRSAYDVYAMASAQQKAAQAKVNSRHHTMLCCDMA
jgi:hypothetical protein